MLFNSIHFLFFFPIVVACYFLLSYRRRWIFLLLASCYFYMAFIPVYILILFLLIGVDYTIARRIEASDGFKRKIYLVISILVTCFILFVFKYYNFFVLNARALACWLDWHYSISTLELVLPIGLSFHTFQSLSYVIEVYKGRQKAERHFGIYALYVMFFPQLVAGPIERPYNLLKQLRCPTDFSYERLKAGLTIMARGFIKKILLADNLSLIVDIIYRKPGAYQGEVVLLATVCFAFQIYYDFAGYSEIAIGAAKVLGIDLMQNFRTPYLSASIREFWSRWHISLSTWFRDYVYIPLGGSKVGLKKWIANIFIVFLISGLWHGANWTFLVWGLLHGCYYMAEKIFSIIRDSSFSVARYAVPQSAAQGKTGLPTGMQVEGKAMTSLSPFIHYGRVLMTFILVCFAWIFFRAESLSDAWDAVCRLLFFWHVGYGYPEAGQDAWVFLLMAIMFEFGWAITPRLYAVYSRRWWWCALVWPVRIMVILVFLSLGNFGRRQFIYFQF